MEDESDDLFNAEEHDDESLMTNTTEDHEKEEKNI